MLEAVAGCVCLYFKLEVRFHKQKKKIFVKALQNLIDYYGKFTDNNAECYTIIDDNFFRSSALFTATKINIALRTAMDVNHVSIPFVTLGIQTSFCFSG